MKLSRCLSTLAILAGITGLAVVAQAQTTIVNDTFNSSADRQSGVLSTDRANWFVLQNSGGSPMSPSGGSDGTPFSVTTSDAGTGANAYMARWTPTTLQVGETLSVSLTFSFTRLPTSTAFRYGIFDSTPNGVITGDVTSANQASFHGDTGYAWTANSSFGIGTTASGNVFRIGERTVLTAGNLFSTGTDFTPLQDANGTNAAWALNTSYTMTMTFYLSSADAMEINATLAGGEFGAGITAATAIDTTTPTTTFDYLLLRAGTGNAQDITFHSLNVGVSAIPEPSTYAAMFGLGALGLVAWRRRRVA